MSPSEIRVGTLVLAYQAPTVLECHARLMPESNFFVHVDAKADMRNFEKLRSLPNIQFSDKRFDVYWGGWNMVRAEIHLLRLAFRAECTRFALVSDDTLPLRSPAETVRSLADNVSHLGLWKMASDDPAGIRYREYFYFDSWISTQRSHDIYRRYYTDTDIACVMELAELKKQGKYQLPAMYKGPQWWCLTRDIVELVLEHFDTQKHFRESFRFSLIPDEHYIHTIIGLSKHSSPLRTYPMWTETNRVPSPWVYRSLSELQGALASERLYVRKVAPELATHLLATSGEDLFQT